MLGVVPQGMYGVCTGCIRVGYVFGRMRGNSAHSAPPRSLGERDTDAQSVALLSYKL